MSFCWQYFFFFDHAPSVWTYKSLRLWCQQLLIVSNWLLPWSWIMLFEFHWNTLHAFQACNQLFYHPTSLYIHKLLLLLTTILSLKYFMQIKLRSESEIILKRTFIRSALVFSYALIWNWNESHWILCVSKTDLYLSTAFSSISIDDWRYDRWSCCFEEMKMENEMSLK